MTREGTNWKTYKSLYSITMLAMVCSKPERRKKLLHKIIGKHGQKTLNHWKINVWINVIFMLWSNSKASHQVKLLEGHWWYDTLYLHCFTFYPFVDLFLPLGPPTPCCLSNKDVYCRNKWGMIVYFMIGQRSASSLQLCEDSRYNF